MSDRNAASEFKIPPNPKADDPKLGTLIRPGMGGDVVIIGFPYDEGCTRNGGRPGAAEGPAYFRRLLSVCGAVHNVEYGVDLSAHDAPTISCVGDVCVGLPLEVAHARLEETVAAVLAAGKIPFVIGGGNDQSAPNGRALLAHTGGDAGVVNIDAHLDVRPPLPDGRVHSGTPFRELLTAGRPPLAGARFAEFACQGSVCSGAHADFVKQQGGALEWLSKVRTEGTLTAFRRVLDTIGPNVFVSFDIDSVCGADCPGVSAPGVIGLSSQEALDMCRIAGAHPSVRMMDLSELNPRVEDYRSPRLACFMFYHFMLGLASRKNKKN